MKVGVVQGIAGEYAGRKIKIAPGETIWMGREPGNALLLHSESVSGYHCGIAYDGETDTFWVVSNVPNGVAKSDGEILPEGREIPLPSGTILQIASRDQLFLLSSCDEAKLRETAVPNQERKTSRSMKPTDRKKGMGLLLTFFSSLAFLVLVCVCIYMFVLDKNDQPLQEASVNTMQTKEETEKITEAEEAETEKITEAEEAETEKITEAEEAETEKITEAEEAETEKITEAEEAETEKITETEKTAVTEEQTVSSTEEQTERITEESEEQSAPAAASPDELEVIRSEGSDLPSEAELYYTSTPEKEIAVTADGIQYGACELIVQMGRETTKSQAETLAKKYGAELAGFLSITGTCQWRFPETREFEELQEIAGKVQKENGVKLAALNYISEAGLSSSGEIPQEGEEWNKKSSWDKSKKQTMNWGYLDSGALAAWQNREWMAEPVKVAVLDGGFQMHPDLAYILQKPGKNVDPEHGTHVAGILGAVCNNGIGMSGVYPMAAGNVLAYDVLGTNSAFDVYYSIADAVARDVRVLNLSVTYDGLGNVFLRFRQMEGHDEGIDVQSDYKKWAEMYEYFIQELIDAEYQFFIVVAAGNHSSREYDKINSVAFMEKKNKNGDVYYQKADDALIPWPGKKQDIVDPRAVFPLLYIENQEVSKRILCVGAYNQKGKVAAFSNMSDRVDILAPGQGIYSTANQELVKRDGTSQAAPYVVGAIADIWAVDSSMTADQVRSILLESCTEKIMDEESGYEKPVLNIESMMETVKALKKTEEDSLVDISWWEKEEEPSEEKEEAPLEKLVHLTIRVPGTEGKKEQEVTVYTLKLTDEEGVEKEFNSAILKKHVLADLAQWSGMEEDTLVQVGLKGGLLLLPPGTYQVEINSEQCVPFWTEITVEDVEGLQEKEIYVAPELAGSLFEADGAVYICGNADTAGPVLDLQEGTVLLEKSTSAVKMNRKMITLDKAHGETLGELRIFSLEGELDRILAENVAGNTFAYYSGLVYYADASGRWMAVDIRNGETTGVPLYDMSSGTGGAGYTGWEMDINTWNQTLCVTALTADGSVPVIYQFNFVTETMTEYVLNIGAGNELELVGFSVDRETAFIGAPDGGFTAFVLSEGSGQEGKYMLAGSSSFLVYEETVYYIEDGSLLIEDMYRQPQTPEEWIDRSNAEAAEKLGWEAGIVKECDSLIAVDAERVYYRRLRWENDKAVGYNYYSCTEDGDEETYYGYALFDQTAEDNAIETEVQSPQPAQSEEQQDPGQNLFAQLPETFVFSSGVGGWGTTLHINEDGSFSGRYEDSNLGEVGEGYPNGSVHFCDFTGTFSSPVQVSETIYSLNLETLETQGTKGDAYIQDGIQYIYSAPYGLEEAKEVLLYLPRTPVSSVGPQFMSWATGLGNESALPAGYYGLYNVQEQYGFVGQSGGKTITAQPAAEPSQGTYILPESSSRYLTAEDLSSLTPQQICYAKNEIYARHGRKFLSSELTAYFNAQPWYQGTIEPDDFTEESVNILFNEYEKANVRFISDWEDAHGEYMPQ